MNKEQEDLLNTAMMLLQIAMKIEIKSDVLKEYGVEEHGIFGIISAAHDHIKAARPSAMRKPDVFALSVVSEIHAHSAIQGARVSGATIEQAKALLEMKEKRLAQDMDPRANSCHPDWHRYMREYFLFDDWRWKKALLLLVGVWPVGANVHFAKDGDDCSPVSVGLNQWFIDRERNDDLHPNLEQINDVTVRLSDLYAQWMSDGHAGDRYPPEYFVEWALARDVIPCWLGLWNMHIKEMPP